MCACTQHFMLWETERRKEVKTKSFSRWCFCSLPRFWCDVKWIFHELWDLQNSSFASPCRLSLALSNVCECVLIKSAQLKMKRILKNGVRRIRKSLEFFCHLEIFRFWNWILWEDVFTSWAGEKRRKGSNKRHTFDENKKKKSMNILPKCGHKYFSDKQ